MELFAPPHRKATHSLRIRHVGDRTWDGWWTRFPRAAMLRFMDAPQPFSTPSIWHKVVAVLVIAMGMWGTGVMLSWVVGVHEVLQVAGAFGILAPLLLIVQQYRATFRSHAVAAQYCWIFFAVVAVIVAAIFLFSVAVFPRLDLVGTFIATYVPPLVASLLVSVVNYNLHRRLLQATAAGLVPPHRGRTSIREMMLWTIAAAAVCAIAAHYVRVGSPFRYL